jgi:hypothetical protein
VPLLCQVNTDKLRDTPAAHPATDRSAARSVHTMQRNTALLNTQTGPNNITHMFIADGEKPESVCNSQCQFNPLDRWLPNCVPRNPGLPQAQTTAPCIALLRAHSNVSANNNNNSVKGKAVPLQAWTGPEGSRKLRLPDFMTTAQDGGRLSALRTGRLYPQEILPVLISVGG